MDGEEGLVVMNHSTTQLITYTVADTARVKPERSSESTETTTMAGRCRALIMNGQEIKLTAEPRPALDLVS